jgi:hypothetical protein
MILLQVRLLELRNFVLCMISILCRRFFEIFCNPLSCFIIRFLIVDPIVRTEIPARMGCLTGAYLQCSKGLDHVVFQNTHKALLGSSLCKCYGHQATVQDVKTRTSL